jgi:flagellar assembly protein FliH
MKPERLLSPEVGKMQLSSKILRGAEIKGWRTYYPPLIENGPFSEGKAAFPLQEELSTAAAPAAPPLPNREEIERERQSILQLARQESETQRQQVIAEAQKEAAKLQEKAWQDGFTQGHLEGEKAADEVKNEARSVLEGAYRQKDIILTGAEPEIIRLAVNLAEKLINYQLSIDENLIIALISRCLESLPGGGEVVLRVSPYDEAACRERVEFIRGMLKKGVDLEIFSDTDIPLGCCKVETEESEVTFLLNRELQILAGKLIRLAESGGETAADDGAAEEMYADEYMADEIIEDELAGENIELPSEDGDEDEGMWEEAAADEDMTEETVAEEGMAEEMYEDEYIADGDMADEMVEDELTAEEPASDEGIWDEETAGERAAHTAVNNAAYNAGA